QTLRRIPGVLEAAAVAERRLLVTTRPGLHEKVFNLFALGVDPLDERQVRTYPIEAGTFLSADKPSDVLVNAGWASENGLGVGDRLLLTGRNPDVPPLRIAGLLGDVGFGALSQGQVLVMVRSALNSDFAIPAPVTSVDLVIAAGRVPDVERGLDNQMTEPFIVETVADAEAQLGRAQAGFAGIAFLFALVALAVGAFLVANTLTMTLSERTREIGLLRAAGLTRGQALGLFLRQGAILAILGAVLGTGLGIGLAALGIGFLRATRAVLVTGLPINPLSLLMALALGVGVTLAASVLPSIAASRVSPLDALRPSRQPGRRLWTRLRWLIGLEVVVVLLGVLLYPLDRGEFSPASVLLATGILVAGTVLTAILLQPLSAIVGRPFEWFFGAEGLLGRANLGRDRARTGLTVGALIVALSAVVALGSVAESARATAHTWVASILPGGYAIRLGLPVDIDAMRPTFEGTAGAAAASPIVEFSAVARQGNRQLEVSLAGIEPSVFEANRALIFTKGRRDAAFAALRVGGAVVVPESLATQDKLIVGSVLQLGVPGGALKSFTVAGVIAYTLPARSPDGAALISLADAVADFGATKASLWALVPQAGFPPDAFRKAVTDTANSLAGEALTADQLASDLVRSLDRLIGLFDVLALLAVVIAGLGVVNTLVVGVAERAREIAILRSHGMTTGQVQAMVVSEAAIMGAVGGIMAVATGLLVAWAIVGAASAGDFGAGLSIPWPLLTSVILLGTGIAALASAYPARLAAGISIVGSIQHFE
ncbi:MAG: FtsX-like permease family protein, partial [Chloroflexota bacterium]|nr:FtsX-like permease family protein [Chloroflexota bacterium]